MGTCATVALDIRTYYAGKNQLTHPNVIAFDKPWHGYRYYMAYTAFPYGNGSEENPCIAVSNDLMHWETPVGLNNPIAWCEETQCDELKDTHLVYREDLDRLEMWYLGRLNGTIQDRTPLSCFRKISEDGIRWSDFELLFSFGEKSLCSPTIIYEDGRYRFWGIRHSEKDICLYEMTSPDGKTWSELTECVVPKAKETLMWHGAITKSDDVYYYVWVGKGEHNQHIFMAISDDGSTFSEPSVIVSNDTGWNYLYRPALLIEAGRFYCFYGVVRYDGKWLVALSEGNDPYNLHGVGNEKIVFAPERSAETKIQRLKIVFAALFERISFRQIILVVPLMLISQFSVWLCWLLGIVVCSAMFGLLIEKKDCFLNGLVNGTFYAAVAVFLAQLLQEVIF